MDNCQQLSLATIASRYPNSPAYAATFFTHTLLS
jgi:hypothetical protein